MAYYDYPYYYPNYYSGYAANRFQDWRDQMFVGESIIGEYGDYVGTVRDIYDSGFWIDRPYGRDIFLPFDAIQDVFNDQVQLNFPAYQVGSPDSPFRAWNYGEGYGYGYGPNYGPYTGYGPRNYQRSDNRIRDDINDQLWASGQLDASGITVSVDDGVVTLDGTVDSLWAKRKADDLAWSVPGVVDVINNLRRTGALWNDWRSQLHSGMDVVGSLGSKIGTVGEIRDYQFLANRPGESGLWIPFSGVQDVRNNRVILNVTKDEIKNQNWLTTETQPA